MNLVLQYTEGGFPILSGTENRKIIKFSFNLGGKKAGMGVERGLSKRFMSKGPLKQIKGANGWPQRLKSRHKGYGVL